MYVTFAAIWNGKGHIIAIDYDRYCISIYCHDVIHERKYVPVECYKPIANRIILDASQISKSEY